MLAVDGVPVLADEVEPLARDVGELYPEYTLPHRRRLALTNAILPRAACRARYPEQRAAQRAAAESARGQISSLEPRVFEGNFGRLGLELWSAARRLEPLAWSEPIELAGRFVLVRLEAPPTGAEAGQEVLRLSLLEFPFVDPSSPVAALQRAVDESRLTIIDPAWDEFVPEAWKHRMRGNGR